MKTILDEIFEVKRQRVEEAKRSGDQRQLALEVRSKSRPNSFCSAFAVPDRLNIIAEFKKASPSKGIINDGRDPVETAEAYQRGGAVAISVLTEEDFFKGSLDDLKAIRAAVSVPVLRKDFIFDEFQVYEAAAAGADALLLIIAALDIEDLRTLHRVASELGMDVLVEVHTPEEMMVAGTIGARLIGVNNRDLRTFDVSLDVSRDLAGLAPRGAVLISESGLRTRDELLELKNLGYSGFLIGETLMRSGDPESELRKLCDPSTATSPV